MSHEGLESDPGALEFERRARELLERSARELPGRIRSRLTQARYAALDPKRPISRRRAAAWSRWLPAGAAAALVLALLLVQAPRIGTDAARGTLGGSDDLEMLADSSAYALAQDQPGQGEDVDYEFYDWAVSTERDERGDQEGS